MRICKLQTPSPEDLEEVTAKHHPPDYITAKGRRIRAEKPRDGSRSAIYFIGAMGADLVKIGWVLDLEKIDARLDRMRIDCPYPVMPLLTVGPASRVEEARIHKHFLKQHFHGEWFRFEGTLRNLLELGARDEQAAAAEVRRAFTVRF